MVDLENAHVYQEIDGSGMLGHLRQFPEQCSQAWEEVLKLDLSGRYDQISGVVILGMGGSAIGGDMVRRLALAESRLPVWVHRDYGLPPFVDNKTLVIAISYSGNTEETLSAFVEASRRDARRMVITSGGRLRSMAESEGIPGFFIDYQAPPRAAFPQIFIPLLGIFQKLSLLSDKGPDLQRTLDILRKLSENFVETTPMASNPAKQLASKLWGRIPVTYGAEALSEVAQRWKAQFNENGKTWAFFEVFPELNHNAVTGYQFPSQVKERLLVVLLRSSMLHPRNLLRCEATEELLATAGIAHESVEAQGGSPLAHVMSLVLLGDYVSFYLALLNGVDPTPVQSIDFVKQYVARFPTTGG